MNLSATLCIVLAGLIEAAIVRPWRCLKLKVANWVAGLPILALLFLNIFARD